MLVDWPGDERPLRDGAQYLSFGCNFTSVDVVGGGRMEVCADVFGERSDFVHFSDMFVPEGRAAPVDLLESVVVDSGMVRRLSAGRDALDPDYGVPPFRSVAAGLVWWRLTVRSGHSLLVAAHGWEQSRRRRIVFTVQTEGGRGPSLLPVLTVSKRVVSEIRAVELE